MNSQVQQNCYKLQDRYLKNSCSQRHTTTQRNQTPINLQRQSEASPNAIKNTMNSNNVQQSPITKINSNLQKKKSFKGEQYRNPNSSEVWEQHRRFLENYKKQREEQLKGLRGRQYRQQDLKQQSQQSSYQEENKSQQDVYQEVVGQRLSAIHAKIQRELLHQKWDDERPTFKIFTEVIETKKDIERIQKEKRFIKSQQFKYLDYQQPQMPANYKAPLEYRIKSQSFQDEIELNRKAKEFVQKLQRQQENLLGKQVVRKKKEEFKRNWEQKEKMRQQEQIREIEKQQRKLKAEQNLLLLKEKMRINQIINKHSLEELRELLQQKQQKLQEVRESLKHKDVNHREIHPKFHVSKSKQRVKTSINEYTSYHESQNLGKKNIGTVQEISSNYQRKLNEAGIRAKLAIKRHRLSKPVQQTDSNTQRQNQFFDRYLQLPRKFSRHKLKSKQQRHTTSIVEYPKSQLSEKNEKIIEQGQVAITHHNYTQYDEGRTNNISFIVPKLQLKQDQQKQFDDK